MVFKFFPFVETKKVDSKGESPVYLIVSRKGGGRFWLATGLLSRGKLVGMAFPDGTTSARVRTLALCRMVAETEEILHRKNVLEMKMAEVKELLAEEVLGIVPKRLLKSLAAYVDEFSATKRKNTRVLYGITHRKLLDFDASVTLDGVDGAWLERFRRWCLDGGMRVNGAAKELRNIRAVFNWARRRGLTENYPFLDYSIVEEETTPNNISVEELRRFRDYPCEDWQRKYVDFFMLSFYLAGINPVDLLHLRKDDMSGGYLRFVRRKTNKEGARRVRQIVLPVVDEARAIIEKYPSREGFLLGFMDGRKDYHSFVRKCGHALKTVGGKRIVPDKIGRMRKVEYLPILRNVTLYTARYTFGSIAANDLDISERTIGLCLGHSWSGNVTARYISHDQRKIDNAVMRVAEFVR